MSRRLLYHATGYGRGDEILNAGQFQPSRMGESGPGVYLTADRAYAEKLSGSKTDRVLFTVEADIANPLVRRSDDPDDEGERIYRELQQTHPPYRDAAPFQQALAERGYDAVETHHRWGHEIAVHDPARLRILKHERLP